MKQNIYKALQWCGITWDEGPDIGGPYGPYRQSERSELYTKHCNDLLRAEKRTNAFARQKNWKRCGKCSKQGGRQGYDRRCRNLSETEIKEKEAAGMPYVIRLKMPLTGECVYEDADQRAYHISLGGCR